MPEKSKANFFYPETWDWVCFENNFGFNTKLANYWICPECSALVVDAKKHYEWHKENDEYQG